MTKGTEERIGVLEEKVDAGFKDTNRRIDDYYKESRDFHADILVEIRNLDGEKVQMATLKEKVRSLEKLVWLVGTATAVALINTLINLMTKVNR